MIQVEHSDSIIDIIEKIELCNSEDIVLHFPLWHTLIHNFISLKILKSKVTKGNFTIVTHDRIAKKIGKKLGIDIVYQWANKIKDSHTKTSLFKNNFSILEYIRYEKNRYINEFSSLFKKRNKNTLFHKISQEKTHSFPVHFLFVSLIISVVIFIFLYYTTISKSEVYITPEVKVKKEALNFIFKENVINSILWQNKTIKIEKHTVNIILEEIFWSTDFEVDASQLSRWKIIIYNSLEENIKLVQNTRFSTIDWVEFITENPVTIPAWLRDNFWNISKWSIEIDVIAKLKDTIWNYTGKRWNIPKDTKLTIPWLWEEFTQDVYAISKNDFLWWSEDFKKKISPNDLESAEKIFTEKIKTQAYNTALKEIQEKSILNNSSLQILWWTDSIQYSDIEINSWDINVWDIRDSFTISWSTSLTVYMFNTESVIQKLKTIITEKNLQWVEKISHIDDSSLRFAQSIYVKKSPFELKGTYEIDFFTLHDFSNEDSWYIKNLKNKIKWLHEDEAYKILINDSKISGVDIKIRPFFINNISNIYNNIIIKIEEK